MREIFWDEILPHIQGWETQTWKEILPDAKKQNHSIDVTKLNKTCGMIDTKFHAIYNVSWKRQNERVLLPTS